MWAYEGKVGVHYTILNLDKLYEGKYKYCGYQNGNLFEYLRAYEKDPQIEFFGKIGIRPSKLLVSKCKKDKGFAHFLWQNKDDYFTPKALIYAYDHHIDCETAQEIISEKARNDQRPFKRCKITTDKMSGKSQHIVKMRLCHNRFNEIYIKSLVTKCHQYANKYPPATSLIHTTF